MAIRRDFIEADLYEPVKKHLEAQMMSWSTRIKANVEVGEVDVLGVRYAGGELSGRNELIAIEVKPDTSRFAASAGQTHGYSVVADRCYLAAVTPAFTPMQVLIASRLGIGLLRIWQTPSGNFKCGEVLSAPTGEPVEELRLRAADRLGLASCSLCATLFWRYLERTDDYKGVLKVNKRGQLGVAADQEQGLMWWLHDQAYEHGLVSGVNEVIKVRRYLCPDCTYALAPG